MNTLLSFKYHPHLRAKRGEHGRGKNQHGKHGQDLFVQVPPGTIVRDAPTREVLADLKASGEEVVVAKGGKGGKGNAMFVSSTNRAPRFAQPGLPGEERTLMLELRLLADVGLVGLPNVGKSTLITAVSAARPRIADFPFTTLTPHLGVVRYGEEGSFVMADIPGLIEGAHRGEGLGLRFLRHLSRTSLLLHLLDVSSPERDPLKDYDTVSQELAYFDPSLAGKPQIVVVTKLDLPATRERLSAVRQMLARRGVSPLAVSAVTHEGIKELIWQTGQTLDRLKKQRTAEAVCAW
jgi:GTP-binding protein